MQLYSHYWGRLIWHLLIVSLIKVIGRLWASDRAEFINKLKQRTLGAAALVGTDYHLNITVAESTLSKLQEPTALFDFTISNPSHEMVSTLFFFHADCLKVFV